MNKEEAFDLIFRTVPEFYDCKGVLHIGLESTGKPGAWKARPYCGKRLTDWIGFSDPLYSKTNVICPHCLIIHLATQISKNNGGKSI